MRLRGGRERKLTLVSAPAGYGKTTLLARWMATPSEWRRFAWISLEAGDADRVRLWSHALAALRGAGCPVSDTAGGALAGGPGAVREKVIPLLIEDLVSARPTVLVLDDWHAVRSPVCDPTVTTLVERASPTLQVVISSRSDPGLPIARFRAYGELAEIRAAELRVVPAQAAKVLSASGVDLEGQEVERLTTRTEGWLAGLRLAAIALRQQDDPKAFVDGFSGETRYVLDYLAREVVDGVEPELRDFLVRSSVLERLSAGLCDAVLETSGSGARLAEIERANLFLEPIDESGGEYRYHQLFATMLRRELATTDPSAAPGLHARASAWFEANGDVDTAVAHAITARDVPRASSLIARHGPILWSSGRVLTVARWLEALSWPEALQDRQLALVRSQVAGVTGRGADAIERWLDIAETAPDAGPLANGLASLRSAVAMQRSGFVTRGVTAAEREARIALEHEAPRSPWRRVALVLRGQALYLLGRFEEARVPLEEARTLPGAERAAAGAALGLAYLALSLVEAGEVAEAERIARSALVFLQERGLSTGIAAGHPHLALGVALARGCRSSRGDRPPRHSGRADRGGRGELPARSRSRPARRGSPPKRRARSRA